MPKDVSNDDLLLPFPGEYKHGDGFATQYIAIGSLTNVELSEHCKTFKLAHSGNKAALTARLREFSKNKSRWDSLLPGATNAHKGTRKIDKKTKSKPSALRRENLFSAADNARTANIPVTERSKDLRTVEEKAAIIPWAKRIVSKHPYQPIGVQSDSNHSIYSQTGPAIVNPFPQATSTSQLPLQQVSNADGTTQLSATSQMLVSEFLAFFRQRIGNTATNPDLASADAAGNLLGSLDTPALGTGNSSPTLLAPDLSSVTAPVAGTTSVYPSESGNTISAVFDNVNSMAVNTVRPPGDSVSSNGDVRTRTLAMAFSKYITFQESDIPDPPAVSYAKNIEGLLLVWDDRSASWSGSSPLIINTVPIPLIYWPTVYKYWKGTQWEGVKKMWFDWKTLVHCMSQTSKDEFWARFSITDKNGNIQRMKYTPILKKLANERKEENEKLAALALSELTTEDLSYRKGGKIYVMRKPAMIAAHYRRLKGLASEDFGDDDES
ncbi:hypothetical protein B0H10DRAFT_2033346 [Mycena sp. CBHHK59/15]|nr:hypothetical protein B0H10DRAFT_1336469 [Mycena sp. CBHHK59/15]KAJ6617425.1 hypothetical protein B0H10DRAFT_2033346 [Mycena sp. CBHHK59/15]